MGKNLSKLMNLKKFEQLCEKFANLMGVSIALIDAETQEPYFAVSQTKACKFFHKNNDISDQQCLISNKLLVNNFLDSESISIEMCLNGLMHSATPIIIDNEHVASLFIGQFLFEEPAMEFFEQQALEYGFDKEEYIEAIKEVPILSKEILIQSLEYLAQIASWVAEIGKINTNLKENEQQLQEQNVELQSQQKSILDNIPNPVWLKDTECRILFVNQSYIDLIELSNEQIIGKTDLELFPDKEKAQSYLNQDKDVIRTGKIIKVEESVILKNKKYLFEVIKMPLVDFEGKITGTIGLAHDISERKTFEDLLKVKNEELLMKEESLIAQNQELLAKEETLLIQNDELLLVKEQLSNSLDKLRSANLQLSDANAQKTKFLSNMSHELRTPLNAILGFTNLLKKEYYGPINKKQDEYIDLIHTSGSHLLSLINDILDIAKINAGSVEMNYESFEINTLIIDLIKLMKDQFKDKRVELAYDTSSKSMYINGDKRKYKQILLNLLQNALKFTRSGGRVDVYASEVKPNKIKISVNDNGIGISKEDQDHLFNEFYQTSQAVNMKQGGTGIGLALTKKLVEIHGGTIGVISDLNKGSTFWFEMPVDPNENNVTGTQL